jgi:hypothetical protein
MYCAVLMQSVFISRKLHISVLVYAWHCPFLTIITCYLAGPMCMLHVGTRLHRVFRRIKPVSAAHAVLRTATKETRLLRDMNVQYLVRT